MTVTFITAIIILTKPLLQTNRLCFLQFDHDLYQRLKLS